MTHHGNNPDACVACTSCLVFCPVTAASPLFRGPKMLGPALERFRLLAGDAEKSLEYCSNCKNCDMSCPSGVPVSTLNMLAKYEYYKTNKRRPRDWMLAHGEKMARIASQIPRLANMGMANPVSRMLLKAAGIALQAQLPPYAPESFYSRFKKIRQRSCSDKVVFFPGCFINYNDPQVGLDFVAVMKANGFEVVVPDNFVCCGSPLVAGGYLDEAKRHEEKNVAAIKEWTDKGYPVVTCCTSCSLMLKREYQELFGSPDAALIAGHIFDAAEFLLALHEQKRLNTELQKNVGPYLYHAPCHLRAQGIGRPALDLLALVPGLDIADADAGCCGISGSYGFKEECYDIAMAVGDPLFRRITASKVPAVLSDCGTCRWQIMQGTGVPALHPITVLKDCYAKI